MDEIAANQEDAAEKSGPHTEAEVVEDLKSRRDRLVEEIRKRKELVANYGRNILKIGIFFSIACALLFIVGYINIGNTGFGPHDEPYITHRVIASMVYALTLFGLYFYKNSLDRFYIMILLPLVASGLVAAPIPFFKLDEAHLMTFALFMAIASFIIIILGGAYAASVALIKFPISKSLSKQKTACAIVSLISAVLLIYYAYRP